MLAELEKLRQNHLTVDEDCWYSCPKSEDYCNTSQRSVECNCGADEHNKILDGIISFLNQSRLRGRTIDDLPESIQAQLLKCSGDVADVCVGGIYVRYRHNGVRWIRGE